MKTEDLITIFAAGVLAYVAWKTFGKTATTGNGIKPNAPPANVNVSNGYAVEIANNADPTEPGWGWKYYTNGVAISPDGTYYMNDKPVWNF